MTALLSFTQLSRSYGRNRVLEGLAFEVQPGEVVGLLGRNGAGKTTLLHLAMGLMRPDAGEVRVFGLDPFREGVAVKRRVGFVSEDQVLPAGMRAEEVLEFHRWLFPDWDAALERRLCDRFRFSPRTRVSALSKGQARQLALVCAVAHRPELLLLDEPAGGLDPAARREFLETSIQLLSESGTTIVFSSHHMTDVERMAGRVALLDGRRLRIDCPTDEVRERHCLVTAQQDDPATAAGLEALPGCLRVRRHLGALRAVCAGSAEEVGGRLRAAGLRAGATSVPLEELFIELLGGEA